MLTKNVIDNILTNIQEQGHWKLLGKNPKKTDYSLFVNDEDAKKVRTGKTIYQKKVRKEEKEPITVAIDLDGTLAKHYTSYKSDHIPEPRPGAKKAVDELQKLGCIIIINTVRGNEEIIKQWCQKHDIHYDYINENPNQPPNSSGKIYADVYIDDRAEDGSKQWSNIVDNVKKRLKLEDQLKFPNRKRIRDFSMYRSSFGKSKTFGGIGGDIKESLSGNISGSSIPIGIEPNANLGLVGADRSPDSHKPVKSYDKRKDLTDLPTKPPEQGPEVTYSLIKPSNLQPMVTYNDNKDELGFEECLDSIIERTIKGGTRDNKKRLLNLKRNVPLPDTNGDLRPTDDISIDLSPFITTEHVKLDDIASKERDDPTIAIARELNLRPLGEFGPEDKRQPPGGPVTNVRTQHPPDRSFEANSPKVAVTKSISQNPRGNEDVESTDPLKMSTNVNLLTALINDLTESLCRPEDDYDLLQRIINELGLSTVVRKISTPLSTFVRACDGRVKLEICDGKLIVYIDNKVRKEFDVCYDDTSLVDKVVEIVRGIN